MSGSPQHTARRGAARGSITGDMSGSFFANNYPCLMAGVAMGRTLTFAMKSIKQMAGLE